MHARLEAVFADGALAAKIKQIIAVAVAHVTHTPARRKNLHARVLEAVAIADTTNFHRKGWQIEFDAPEPARLMSDVPHEGLA
jgi:hypothetical protein